MHVILDTNILLSGLIASSGPPGQLIVAWRRHRFTLISHSRQLDELRDVSRRDKFKSHFQRPEMGKLINKMTALAIIPERLPVVDRSPDPNDDFLLALCEAGGADRLVTGDKADLLALRRHGPTRIVSAAAFAAELGLQSPAR